MTEEQKEILERYAAWVDRAIEHTPRSRNLLLATVDGLEDVLEGRA